MYCIRQCENAQGLCELLISAQPSATFSSGLELHLCSPLTKAVSRRKQSPGEDGEGNEKKELLQLFGRSSAGMMSERHLIRTKPCGALCEKAPVNDGNTTHTLAPLNSFLIMGNHADLQSH